MTPQAGHLPHREGHLFMKRNPTQNSEWGKAQKFLVSGGAPGFGFHHVVWCSSRWWRRSSGRWWCLMPRSFPPKLCHPRLHSTSPLRPLTTPTLPPSPRRPFSICLVVQFHVSEIYNSGSPWLSDFYENLCFRLWLAAQGWEESKMPDTAILPQVSFWRRRENSF